MDNSGLVGVRHVIGRPRVGKRGHVTCFPAWLVGAKRLPSWRPLRMLGAEAGGSPLVLCFWLLEERNCEQHVYQSAAVGSAIIDLER
jgi:hypothetical protein